MCHVHLSLNPQPKSFGTHSWVGTYQPLVWEQSEASGSRKLLYHTAFWCIGESLTTSNISLHQAEWTPVPLTTCQVLQRKKWIFPQSHRGDDSYFCKYCRHPWVSLQKGFKQCHGPKRHPCGAALSSKAFLHLSGCIHSWKPQESKANVFTFQQLNPTGRITCKQEKQGELPLKCQIFAGWKHDCSL